MVHLARVFGKVVSTVAVTITGTGNDSTFVTIGGISYKSSASTMVAIGDVIHMEVGASTGGGQPKIQVDGSIVKRAASLEAISYAWQVPDNISAIAIALNASYYSISVTTS